MFRIADLADDNLWDVASFCLKDCRRESWYADGDEQRIREAWQRKRDFLAKKLVQGARAKIAYREELPVGFIEYYPIELTNMELAGRDIMTVWCLNVAPKERGKGIGSRLLQECITDAKRQGSKGVAVTCWDPAWMPSGFFKKQAFIEVGKASGNGTVLFYPLAKTSHPVWIGRGNRYEEVKLVKGKAVLDIFHSDRCPIHWRNTALVKDIAVEFRRDIVTHEHNVDDRGNMLRHRIAYSIYLNGEAIAAGPEVRPAKIREKLLACLAK